MSDSAKEVRRKLAMCRSSLFASRKSNEGLRIKNRELRTRLKKATHAIMIIESVIMKLKGNEEWKSLLKLID